MPKQKETIEFRYYNIPDGSYVLPKIGYCYHVLPTE